MSEFLTIEDFTTPKYEIELLTNAEEVYRFQKVQEPQKTVEIPNPNSQGG